MIYHSDPLYRSHYIPIEMISSLLPDGKSVHIQIKQTGVLCDTRGCKF